MAANYASGGSPTASALIYQYIDASSAISTTSGSFVTTGISLVVLQTGVYKVEYYANTRIGNSGSLSKQGQVTVYHNGVNNPDLISIVGSQLAGLSLGTNSFD